MRAFVAFAIAALMLACALAMAVEVAQPTAHAQLRNPYWPFSVETSVRDR